MKLHFDSKQEYQIKAVESVIKLFEGQTINKGEFELTSNFSGFSFSDFGFGNRLELTHADILNNLRSVQQENDIDQSNGLNFISFLDVDEDKNERKIETYFPNFTIEMETGTGKTYVYLRTIYELNKTFGFTKFVIVVPSVAIREGVLKNLEITGGHFQTLYNRTPINYYVYDSKRLPLLKGFATNNSIQILIISVDSFAKDTNIINQYRDSSNGKKPIEYIQAVQPIVILDEPQNMETDIRKKAITNLNPLFILRYSATHRNIYNLIYKLDPVKAYDLGLVKQIEVDSVFSENDFNKAFIKLENIKTSKTKVSAALKIDVNTNSGVQRKTVKVDSKNYDLYKLSNERNQYKDLLVSTINFAEGQIELSDGTNMKIGETQGALTDQIMKIQIQKTVEEHFIKEIKLKSSDVKVLSLFFIDHVANYRDYDSSGNVIKGKFSAWFEEAYNFYKNKYPSTINYQVGAVHNGYFAQDKTGKFKDSSTGESKADDDTYHLIMKDKERLLDKDEPLRFIFSHSALREGWDNPNVFQICTLNETNSEIKKRQEIGRGLRLCVDQTGQRILNKNINRLTVIANESYEDFAKKLQTEIEEDCGVEFTGRIKDKRKRETLKLKKGYQLDKNFLDLWEKIKHKTRYRIDYSTEDLIKKASASISKMSEISSPIIKSVKTGVDIVKEGVEGKQLNFGVYRVQDIQNEIPDIAGHIQNKTELTRSTIISILKSSNRLKDVLKNPQLFLDQAVREINSVLTDLMIEGIKYEKLGETEYYKMELFAKDEMETYRENLYKVKNQEKTLYNYIEFQSKIEEQFAKDCESNANVEFYIKLPHWFVIKTPIGNYNPDWALILMNDEKIYFVAESKYSLDTQKLYSSENYKIACGKKHFQKLPNVIYKVTTKVNELI
jgi:type III restriction enzyme